MKRRALALFCRLVCWSGAVSLVCATACHDAESSARPGPAASAATKPAPGVSAAPSASAAPAAPSASATPAASPSTAPAACPDGMQTIPGGSFWVGTQAGTGANEESPRFETTVAPFCLDTTEVTVDAYKRCVAAGACKPARDERRFCNMRYPERGDHPVNCVDWHDASAYCAYQHARLPTEVEWEFAARGGDEYRTYSWGNESPDGRTCWKHPGGSCKVKSYPAGAFGLYDMTGNVWEWTETWFGTYPWPPAHGLTKVYRGGSWSRRFDKWMNTKLRNRYRPSEWGSHLGMRCALTLPATRCPAGRTNDGSRCELDVTRMDCAPLTHWNGVRCAREGAPECPEGQHATAGHGCVLDEDVTGKLPEIDLAGVTSARSPGFDPDCEKYYPGRPHAYRYSGGSHAARNIVSSRVGCKNRDVGVGWNSTCCP